MSLTLAVARPDNATCADSPAGGPWWPAMLASVSMAFVAGLIAAGSGALALDDLFAPAAAQDDDDDDAIFLEDRIIFPDGTQTVFYKCQNREAEDLIAACGKLLGDALPALNAYEERKTIIITKARADQLDTLMRLLARLDAPRLQVLIEVKVISLTYDSDIQLGFEQEYDRRDKARFANTFFRGFETTFHPADYLAALSANPPRNNPSQAQIDAAEAAAQDDFGGATISFSAVGGSRDNIGQMDFTIRTLAGAGRASILARPAILCEDGFTAEFASGDAVPIQTVRINNNQLFVDTNFVQTGISLKVKPLLVGDGFVTLLVEPSISAVSQFFDPGGSGIANPIIVRRQAKTTVNLRSGETLEIGGLRSTRTLLTTTGIPLLMDIPVIGYLFRATGREIRRQDVIFWITPTVLGVDSTTGATLDFLDADRETGDDTNGGANGDPNGAGEGGGDESPELPSLPQRVVAFIQTGRRCRPWLVVAD